MTYIVNPTGPTVTTPNIYTTNGTGNSWIVSTPNTTNGNINWTTTGAYTIAADPNLKGNTLHVKGNADFEGDVTIKGKSIKDSLEKIEEKLAILHPNEELEKKWEKLRGLRKMYMELEAEIIEKEKMWDILKK
jgi:hypothetical protein